MARRYRQAVDLYVTGKVVTLRDGTPVWMQALNPFEQDTARNEAQIARARITLALKEHGGDEQAKVKMYFFEDGDDAARMKIVDAKVADAMPKILEKLRIDPEWTERLDVLERGLDGTATPSEPAEIELLAKLSDDYTAEVGTRLRSEREYLEDQYVDAESDQLWEDYLEWYLAKRASELMFAEYRLHQLLFGARCCEGVLGDDEVWDHSACEGHVAPFFLSKQEVQTLPEELVAIFMTAADDVEMTAREAKNSHRQGSSFDSSPLPSEEGESTASIQEEIPPAHRGTSSSPSPTPSTSSAMAR